MSVQLLSGASADLLTVDPTSKAARVTLYNPDGSLVYPGTAPVVYRATSLMMALGTLASGSCIASLENPNASGKNVYLTRVSVVAGFSGTAAATNMGFGVSRSTGTGAAGTGSKATTAIAKRNPNDAANSVCTFRYGPTAITGFTNDTPGDFRSFFLNHQNGSPFDVEPLADLPHNAYAMDGTLILPATAWTLFTRTISVAGSTVAVNLEWVEA